MNPLLKKYAGTVVRGLILSLGLTIDIDDETLERVIEALAVVVSVGWGLWQKYRAQKETNTALALPKSSTFAEVQHEIKVTGGAPAMLPADATATIHGRP